MRTNEWHLEFDCYEGLILILYNPKKGLNMRKNRNAGLHLLLTKHHGCWLSILQHRGTHPMSYRRCVEFACRSQLVGE